MVLFLILTAKKKTGGNRTLGNADVTHRTAG